MASSSALRLSGSNFHPDHRAPLTEDHGHGDEHGDEQHDEPPPAVSLVELFYDLVFVVAIHDVASGLETHEALWPQPVALFLLRMYLVWAVWHRTAGWANIASQIHRRRFRLHHYVLFLLLTAIMSLMARAVKADDNRALLILFGAFIWLNAVCFIVEAASAGAGKERDFIVSLIKMSLPSMAVESGLSALAAYYADTPTLCTEALWSWAALALLFLGTRTLMALFFSCHPAKLPPILFEEEHFAERYALISLIFLGEVVAAGGVQSSGTAITDELLPVASAIATAFQAFLLAFVAQPSARRNPWQCGLVSIVHAPHAYLVMACSLAALGPAYARLIEAAAEEAAEVAAEVAGAAQLDAAAAAHPRRRAGLASEPSSGEALPPDDSVALLFLSVSGFLLASAAVGALGADKPAAKARCGSAVRAAAQALTGVLVGVLTLLPECDDRAFAAALVPLLLAPLTLFQFWAIGSAAAAHDGTGSTAAAEAPPPPLLAPSLPSIQSGATASRPAPASGGGAVGSSSAQPTKPPVSRRTSVRWDEGDWTEPEDDGGSTAALARPRATM